MLNGHPIDHNGDSRYHHNNMNNVSDNDQLKYFHHQQLIMMQKAFSAPEHNKHFSENKHSDHNHIKHRVDSHSLYWNDLNQFKFLGLFTTSAFAIRCVLYPVSLIKTRLQTTKNQQVLASTSSAFKHILTNEGLKTGLYRGFAFNLFGLILEPVFIGTLEYTRMLMKQYEEHHISTLKFSSKQYDTLTSLVSGGVASIAQQSILVPIDVVTQRLMIQAETIAHSNNPNQKLMTALQVIKSIYSVDGTKGFYKGYLLTLSCTVPFSSLVWAMYWKIQQTLEQTIDFGKYSDSIIAPVSAAMASSSASLITQPADVLKTRLQVAQQRGSFVHAVRSLIHERGYLGLWAGSLPRIFIITPTSVLMMSLYELIKRESIKAQY